jgi:predicted MPP superfamily phosphohydrolase
MDKVFLFLAGISAFAIICQWYVITSIRKYIFLRYNEPSRKWAYGVLLLLGLINYGFVKASMDIDAINLYPDIKQLFATIFFSYLGIILVLTLFFLIIGILLKMVDLTRFLFLGSSGKSSQKPCLDERGCFSALNESGDDPAKANSHSEEPVSYDPRLPTRRTVLKLTAAAGLISAFSLAGRGLSEAFQLPKLEEFFIFTPKLPSDHKGFTVIQITDFHYGHFLGKDELTALINQINEVEAQAVFMTGDIFHSSLSPIETAPEVLTKLKPRKFGNFAVMGNHDFYAGEWRTAKAIEDGGITLLRDRWISFSEEDSSVHIGGIDDPMGNWIWGQNFPRFSEFARKGPTIPGIRLLLSHRPNVLPHAAQAGIDLVLAGHIHGGQIIVPNGQKGLSIASVASKYTHGWYSHDDCRMYLNRGAGLTFVPWRVNCRPEIGVFHFLPGSAFLIKDKSKQNVV